MSAETRLGRLARVSGVRDAVHVQTITVEATVVLEPCQSVKFVEPLQAARVVGCDFADPNKAGIVDPWLPDIVRPGEVFQLCLRPGSVRAMRHHWLLEGYPDNSVSSATEEARLAAMAYFGEMASELQESVDFIIQGAHEYLTTGEELCFGTEAYGCLDNNEQIAEFWRHFEALEGVPGPSPGSARFDNFFRCAC